MMKLMHTYDEALKYIFKKEVIKKPSLEKIKIADEKLGHPHTSYKNIHIAGTNGKGSVTKMTFSCLQKAGKKVGCLTSPHLNDIRERIETQDGLITKKELVKYTNQIIKTGVVLSYFEMCCMIAFLHFKAKDCEYAVIEVGLGGKRDATNIIKPVITCITNIGRDHQEILGDTLQKIAKEKAGIIKDKIPLILNAKNSTIEKIAQQHQAPIYYATKKVKTNLLGQHQETNASMAYTICKQLELKEAVIQEGLSDTQHTGRLQYITPNLCIDGAHNKDGIETLKEYIKTIKDKYTTIVYCFTLSKGKNPQDFLVPILGKNNIYKIVDTHHYRLPSAQTLKKQMGKSPCEILSPEQIKHLAKKNPTTLYMVFGSLYMIGNFIRRSN